MFYAAIVVVFFVSINDQSHVVVKKCKLRIDT